jgi:hypothetical protein
MIVEDSDGTLRGYVGLTDLEHKQIFKKIQNFRIGRCQDGGHGL